MWKPEATTLAAASAAHRRRWPKAVAFRLAALLLGFAPFVLCEAMLVGIDAGRPTDFDDPFVGFSAIHPLFVLDEESGRYEIPKSRREHFRPESFPAQKPAGEFRIFV